MQSKFSIRGGGLAHVIPGPFDPPEAALSGLQMDEMVHRRRELTHFGDFGGSGRCESDLLELLPGGSQLVSSGLVRRVFPEGRLESWFSGQPVAHPRGLDQLFCYLLLFAQEHRGHVARALGPMPSVAKVLLAGIVHPHGFGSEAALVDPGFGPLHVEQAPGEGVSWWDLYYVAVVTRKWPDDTCVIGAVPRFSNLGMYAEVFRVAAAAAPKVAMASVVGAGRRLGLLFGFPGATLSALVAWFIDKATFQVFSVSLVRSSLTEIRWIPAAGALTFVKFLRQLVSEFAWPSIEYQL